MADDEDNAGQESDQQRRALERLKDAVASLIEQHGFGSAPSFVLSFNSK
jgi:hypothetical protein